VLRRFQASGGAGFPRVARFAALALATALAGLPLALPAPADAIGPLPECRLDDVRTEPRGYDQWALTQVDWNLTLGRGYRPPDLVSVQEGGVAGGGYVRAVVIDDLRAMAAAAEANGTPLAAWSPYRSYQEQVAVFADYRNGYGFKKAVTFSARPGHSEHQLGVTIDFVAVGESGLSSRWEETPTGAWMAENAWQYGWLMSYPKGKKERTCYSYEPWHYRYVGREMAQAIHGSGLTTREFLWANSTRLDPACMAAPIAELETPGKPRSCPLIEPAPSDGPSGPPPSGDPPSSGLPIGGRPSMGPVPIPTSKPGSGGSVALLEAVPAPLLIAIAVALAFGGILAARRGRGGAPRR